jgi:ribokinase
MSTLMVLGNATLDVVQRVERLPAIGETVLGEAPMRCPGGKGLNQAIVAARAGARVDFAAAIGADDAGVVLRAAVACEPVARVRWIDSPAATDMSSIWVDGRGRNMIASSAAAARGIAPERAAAVVGESLDAGDWLLLQGNLAADATLAAAAAARARGCRVAVNAAPVAFDFGPVLALCDLLIVNEVEAVALTGLADPYAASRRLVGRCQVVLTVGALGAVLLDGASEIAIEAPRVDVVDTAGAGDTLVGLLLAELSLGSDPAGALRLAIAGASLSVTRPGTSTAFPTQSEIAALRRGA